jgi:hypothetical protein
VRSRSNCRLGNFLAHRPGPPYFPCGDPGGVRLNRRVWAVKTLACGVVLDAPSLTVSPSKKLALAGIFPAANHSCRVASAHGATLQSNLKPRRRIMRKVFVPLLVLLAVWLLVADSASAGRRHRARRCCEPCCVSTCFNSCNSCWQPTSCCQPAPSCCQPSGPQQHHPQHPMTAPQRDQREMKPTEMPKAPPPENVK